MYLKTHSVKGNDLKKKAVCAPPKGSVNFPDMNQKIKFKIMENESSELNFSALR